MNNSNSGRRWPPVCQSTFPTCQDRPDQNLGKQSVVDRIGNFDKYISNFDKSIKAWPDLQLREQVVVNKAVGLLGLDLTAFLLLCPNPLTHPNKAESVP